MSVHRFYLPPDQCTGDHITLPRAEAHHAIGVLRLRPNDDVTVLDGNGRELKCHIVRAEKHTVELTVYERKQHPPLPWQLTLVQAIPKHKAMDFIVQKATELGATRIVPVLAARCVSQPDAGKSEKWLDTAIESVKQCGSPWLPQIEEPKSFNECLNLLKGVDLLLIATWSPDCRHPRQCIDGFITRHSRPPATVAIWIGPEGDFTPEEVSQVRAAGAQPVTLGRNVLRSDTAAIYALSVLSYELQARQLT